MRPRVTVLLGFCNSELHLPRALESLWYQSFSDFEVVLIDDGSTDKSYEVASKYAAIDDRFRLYVNDLNQGLTATLNRAISLAKGSLLARMDADDICEPDRLEIQTNYLAKRPVVDIVGSWAWDIDDKGNKEALRKVPTEHKAILSALPWYNPFIHPTVVMRADLVWRLGGYDSRFRTSQDWDLWFRAASKGAHFANIGEPLLHYRTGSGYLARKSFAYRLNEFTIRRKGTKLCHAPLIARYSAIISLVLAVLPQSLFRQLKRLDPRNQATLQGSSQ